MRGVKDSYSASFDRLFGNGVKFSVPKFQRDYSWDIEQWDDLWQDIQLLGLNEDTDHYMGYLVLQSDDERNYFIIDGQQRLSTLCILILAVLKNLTDLSKSGNDAENNLKRKEVIQKTFIGDINYVTLVTQNKLALNRNNDLFYRTYLVPLQKLPTRNLNASERLMKNCFEYFCRQIALKYTDGVQLAEFVDNFTHKLFFTVIRVTDQLNAFKVFETLNARGVQLSSADLLKNYLFQVTDAEGSHQEEIRALEDLWSRILEKLGSDVFPEFLRIFWNSRNRTTRKNLLYKTIRDSISTKEHVFNLLRRLDETADIYQALQDPEDELWRNRPKVKKYLRELQLFSLKQPFSVLIIAYEKLTPEKFEQLLRSLMIVSFRYNIISGYNPNLQEEVYNAIALDINTKKTFSLSDLKPIYPTDEEFTISFSNKEFKSSSRNNQIVKYILKSIEETVQETPRFDPTDENLTLEHILPISPDESWEINDEVLERMVFRIGNLALLEKKLNNLIQNKSYLEKCEAFQKSNFIYTKSISEDYSDWNENSIIQRQKILAKHAKAIWRLQI